MDIANFLQQHKRWLAIAGFVLAILIMLFGLYLMLFGFPKPKSASLVPNQEEETNIPSGGLSVDTSLGSGVVSSVESTPSADEFLGLSSEQEAQNTEVSVFARGGKTATKSLVSGVVKQPIAITGKEIRYYDQSNGKFYRVSQSGEKQELTQQAFLYAKNIIWSRDGQKAIIEFPDGYKISYDFDTSKQATFPKEAEDLQFSDDGEKVGYKFVTNDFWQNWITVANSDNSEVQAIEHLGDEAERVQINWSPTNEVVALFLKGADANTQEIFLVGQNQENFKSLRVDGRGFEGVWSPDGKKMLYSVRNAESQYNPVLWITDAQGDSIGNNNQTLYVKTWARKCAFTPDGDKAICSVPRELPEGAGLYPEIAENSQEDFYSINLQTGISSLLATPVGLPNGFKATNIKVMDDGSALVFRDDRFGGVYELKLE